MTFLSVEGFEEDNSSDLFVLIPAQAVDAAAVPGPFLRDRREDVQIFSFLTALAASNLGMHPISVRPGNDPPDRILECGGYSWATELTQLSVGDVLSRYPIARGLARSVESVIGEQPDRYAHLADRRVEMAIMDMNALPRNTSELVHEITQVLLEDRGYVGEGVDMSAGLPDPWPKQNGFYGAFGTVAVQVQQHITEGHQPLIVAAMQSQFHLSEAVAIVRDRVAEKDDARNNLLLITTGFPDSQGYLAPPDSFLFSHLVKSAATEAILDESPKHLSGIVLSHWQTGQWIELWRSPSAVLPWRGEAS